MQLGELDIYNFISVEDAHTDLRSRGLVLIEGDNQDEDAYESNGAGKSTTFSEAPTWCLFGETIRGYKADKVINRRAKKNCMVGLNIYADNGDVYRIERYRKHSQHGNHVLMFRNGENITAKSDTDTNQAIIDLLGMDFLTFTNSIMFGQGLIKTFASSTDGDQKKILEQMLQIDILRACQDKAKEHVSSIDAEVASLRSEADSIIRTRVSMGNQVEELQIKEAELGDKVAQRIAELNKDLNDTWDTLNGLPSSDDLVADKEHLSELLMAVNQKIFAFREQEDNRAEIIGVLKSMGADITRHNNEIDKLEAKLQGILTGKDIPKTCSACGQSLPLEDTTHVQNHLRESIEENRQAVKELDKGRSELQGLLIKVEKSLEGKKPLEDNAQQLRDAIAGLDRDIKDLAITHGSYTKSIRNLQDLIDEQEALLSTTYAPLIEDLLTKIADMEIQIKELESHILSKMDERIKYEFWVNAFGNQGIKSVLLDSVTPYLNQQCNYYLQKLTGSSINVTFNTQTALKSGEKRDKFSVEVDNAHGDDTYQGNSGGEKRRVDIAINMALQDLVLSRTSKSVDIIVYDEVFEGLDAIGCETVIQLLHEKARACGSVLVITHNPHLKQLFSKSLRVRKRDAKTIIEEDIV